MIIIGSNSYSSFSFMAFHRVSTISVELGIDAPEKMKN